MKSNKLISTVLSSALLMTSFSGLSVMAADPVYTDEKPEAVVIE